jgi:hypothetical protein
MNSKIIETLTRIETKLDEVIAALHAYDGDEWDEPNDALKEAAAQYNEKIHHVTNEEADEDAFDDYGQRVVGDRDSNNNPAKHTVGDKKKSKRKYYKPKNKG